VRLRQYRRSGCGHRFRGNRCGPDDSDKLPDKKAAIAAAFASRFAIGFLIAVTRMPIPGWAQGAIIGLLISIPDAIVTQAYTPILATGIIGDAIIGALANRFVA